MFTRCPNCRADFSLTDQQLEIAAGMVRCGICEHAFNARSYLFKQTHYDTSETVDVELSEEEASAIYLEFLDRELHGMHPHSPEPPKITLPSTFDVPVKDNDIEWPTAYEPEDGNQQEDLHEISIPNIIADDISNLDSEPTHTHLTKWLATFICIALVTSLSLQVIAAFKIDLIPQQHHSKLCKWITCTIKTPQALSKIEVLNRSIYTHPTEKQALMVMVTIINRAKFSQPYPLIQLRLFNIAGDVIAARQFAANHYLKDKWTSRQLMETSIPLSITLEVHDAGEAVVSYDFEFL